MIRFSRSHAADPHRGHRRSRAARLSGRGPHAAHPARPARSPSATIRALRSTSSSSRCSRSVRSRFAAPGTRCASCRRSQLRDGVWTVSAGNAAQGVAFAARRAGAPCSVMVMDTAPDDQAALDREASAPPSSRPRYDECWQTVESHASPRMHGHFVHPFDDDRFIAGNGTAGLEILEDLPDVDAVVAPLGGGGLLGGHRQRVCGRASPACASMPPNPRRRRRCERRWPGAKPMLLRRVAAVVRRRRRRQVGAADDVAAAEGPGRRLDRDVARRHCRGDAARRRARSRHRRRRRPACAIAAALSGRAGTGKIVAVVSGGNIDLADSPTRRRRSPESDPNQPVA